VNIPQSVGRPTAKCSYCGEPIGIVEPNLMPFCSRRCKELDLGNWLTESYGMPYEGDESVDGADFSAHEDEDL
jgi:endogenous inhibitor of DNA gyrase (YacG/DUF329 family)